MKIIGVRATGRTNDESDFQVFDVSDIYYVEMSKPSRNSDKQPLFHTSLGSFYQIGSLDGLRVVLADYNVTPLDIVNLVNIKSIRYIEETKYYIRAYFENGTYTSISKSNLYKVDDIPRKNT